MIKNIIYITLIVFIFQNCANPKPPTGGLKDEEAPIIDTTYPVNYNTNFNRKVIVIDFNEKIQINQIEQNLFITPYIDNPYKVKVKKKRLTITFENFFFDNTTYTLNFGKSIKDVTERNEAKTLKYVFSTGDYIDSLIFETKAVHPLNNKPCVGCMVALYNATDTNTVEKNKPMYYAFTDKTGIAKIYNIKNNSYLEYIVDDENDSYTYDKKETVGFNKDTILINKNIKTDNINMIKESIRKQKLIRQKNILSTHQFQFSKGIKSFVITDTNNIKKTNLKYWYTDAYNLNLSYIVDKKGFYKLITVDSLSIKDTFNITLEPDTNNKYILINSNTILHPEKEIELYLSNSIETIDKTKFRNTTDSIYSTVNKVTYDSVKRMINLKIADSLLEKSLITIKLDSGAICNGYKCNNKQLFKISIKKKENLGSISGKIKCEGSYVLELLDESYKILQSFKDIKEYKIINLSPATYKMRVRFDLNNNGVWDAGNFERRELPEPIFFHKEDIKLRKGWEMNDINIKCIIRK